MNFSQGTPLPRPDSKPSRLKLSSPSNSSRRVIHRTRLSGLTPLTHMRAELSSRLLPGTDPEIEWLFLLHESYVGERCGVGLLRSLADRLGGYGAFAGMIKRQLADEESHCRTYEQWLGADAYRGTRYDAALGEYVRSLNSVTLEVFVIQALLEGFSLGALEYRARAVKSATSEGEHALWDDEMRHVQFSYGYLRTLMREEGVIAPEVFERVAGDVKGIFVESFAPARIAEFVKTNYDVRADDLTEQTVRESEGRTRLAWLTLGRVARCKLEFTRRYHAATLSVG